MPAVLHLRSLGQLTSDLQRSYAALAKAVDTLGVKATVTIDGVAYFDVEAVERIAAARLLPLPHGSKSGAFVAEARPQAPTPGVVRTRSLRHRRQEKPHNQSQTRESPQ